MRTKENYPVSVLFLSAFFVFCPDCLFDDKFCLLNIGIFQALSEALQAYRKAWLKLCVLYALFIDAIVACFGRPFPFGGFRWTKSL